MRRTVVPLWLSAAAQPRAGAFIVLFSIEAWSRATLITLVPLQAHKLLGDAQTVSFVYFFVSVFGMLSTLLIPSVVHLIRRRWAFTVGVTLMFAVVVLLLFGNRLPGLGRSLGRSVNAESSIQMRPPPAPQQKEFSRLRGISTSSMPHALITSRGASKPRL